MRNSTKQTAKNTRIRMLMLIISAVLGLAAFLICEFAVGKEKLGFAPIFMLFIVYFMLVGVEYLVYSLIKKRTLMFSVGGLSLLVGAFILMLCLKAMWYVVLAITIVLCMVIFFSVFLFKAPETTLEFDNGEDSQRKPYEERKAELEAKNAAELEAEKNKELPEIKSFKD